MERSQIMSIEDRIEALQEVQRKVKIGTYIQGKKVHLSQDELKVLIKERIESQNLKLPEGFLNDDTKLSKFDSLTDNYKANIREDNIDDAEELYTFIEKKYNDKVEEVAGKEEAKKIISRSDELSDYFVNELRDGFNYKFDSQKDKKIEDYISNRKKIPKDSVDEYVTAFPSFFMSIIDSSINNSETSQMIWASSSNTYNANTIKSNIHHTKNIDEFEGVLLGHALNPFPDNIALLMELGRFKRLESVYGKKGTIILTDPEYALHNEVRDILLKNSIDESTLINGLSSNFKYRKKLYKLLGFEGDNLDILKVESRSPFNPLSREDFKDHAGYYLYFSESINKIKENISNEKQETEYIIDELLSEDEMDSEIFSLLKGDIQFLKFNRKHKLVLSVLSRIQKDFGGITKDIIWYTLLQRFAQHKYSNFLKFGNKGEIRFDRVYALLDEEYVEKGKELSLADYNLFSIYYNHYQFSIAPDIITDCIPYYYPNKAMYKSSGYDITTIYNHIPTVLEKYTDEGSGYKKIIYQSNKLHLFEIVRQISDLLSFSLYGLKESKGDFWNDLHHISQKVSSDFADAIERDRKRDQDYLLKSFGNKVLSIMSKYIEIPYYYYPYIFFIKSKQDPSIETKLRTYYQNLVCLTMGELQTQLKFPNWQKS